MVMLSVIYRLDTLDVYTLLSRAARLATDFNRYRIPIRLNMPLLRNKISHAISLTFNPSL